MAAPRRPLSAVAIDFLLFVFSPEVLLTNSGTIAIAIMILLRQTRQSHRSPRFRKNNAPAAIKISRIVSRTVSFSFFSGVNELSSYFPHVGATSRKAPAHFMLEIRKTQSLMSTVEFSVEPSRIFTNLAFFATFPSRSCRAGSFGTVIQSTCGG